MPTDLNNNTTIVDPVVPPNTVDPASTVTTVTWDITTPWGTILQDNSPNEPAVTDVKVDNTIVPEVTPPVVPPVNGVVPAIEKSIDVTNKQIANLSPDASLQKSIETTQLAQRKAEETAFAKTNKAIIEDNAAKQAAKELEIDTLAKERSVRDVAELQDLKTAEIKKGQLIVEEQRLENKMAVEEAETKVEVAKQQSTWAFNKLWLWFSSWIINEVQRIATNWATAIAKLKVTWAKLVADSQIQVLQLEQKYSSEINWIVDKYTDVQIKNDQDTINRISDVQNNLLLNQKQKQDKVNELTDNYVKSQKEIEDELRKEQERLTDKTVAQATALANEKDRQKNVSIGELWVQLQSGNLVRLTDAQRLEQEMKLGLPTWTINSQISESVSQSFRQAFDVTASPAFPINNMPQLTKEAQDEMKQGRSFTEAIQNVMSREISRNSKLRQASTENTFGKPKASGWSDSWKSNDAIVASLLATAEQYWEELSVERAKAIAKGWMTSIADYTNNIAANSRIKPKETTFSDTTKSTLDLFKTDNNSGTSAKKAYNSLVSDWYSEDEALNILSSQDKNLQVITDVNGNKALQNTTRLNENILTVK